MYAKIQEIQFPDDLDWNITFTEWSPSSINSNGGINEANNRITNSVTKMYELEAPETGPPFFLQDWIQDWDAQWNAFQKKSTESSTGYGEIVGAVVKMEYSVDSKRMAILVSHPPTEIHPAYAKIANTLTCPCSQYHIEFGTGLQYRFGLPAMIGRNLEELYRAYPEEPNYRARKTLAVDGVEETQSDYDKYKADALADWKAYVVGQRELRSRIMGPNVTLYTTSCPDDFPVIKDIVGYDKTTHKCTEKNFDLWVFDGGIVTRDQARVHPPHYLYFSHADLCGNSLNLQRSTCLCDYPQGTVYDSRDEYLYVHNCSPFPNISFTAYTPKAITDGGGIEYEKYLYYPQQFYVIIDYYEG